MLYTGMPTAWPGPNVLVAKLLLVPCGDRVAAGENDKAEQPYGSAGQQGRTQNSTTAAAVVGT
jgi:hypothetical protein